MRDLAYRVEFGIGDVPVPASFGESLDSLAGVWRVGVALLARLVENVAQQSLFPVRPGLCLFATVVEVLPHVEWLYGVDHKTKISAQSQLRTISPSKITQKPLFAKIFVSQN